MQVFEAGPVPTTTTGPKNYVFVDEHNRHKRLKVMRACEGCRRRKIKCDSATTNTWPCAACKRLKLSCVPPTISSEDELETGTDQENLEVSQLSEPEVEHYRQSLLDGYHGYHQHSLPYTMDAYSTPYPHVSTGSSCTYQLSQTYMSQQADHSPGINTHLYSGTQLTSTVLTPHSIESVTVDDLMENVDSLCIKDDGIAQFTREKSESYPEAPVPLVEEDDEDIPIERPKAGSQIRIPPALMPTDEEASKSFQDFFEHVHPYMPVLDRKHFFYQWHQDRSSLSPLLLECVLACAGQVSDDPAGGSQWLALANRHENSFLDKPRLSTLQALLLLLKARERTPRHGYYYRSWVLVKKIVSMAKDLELHEHLDLHRSVQGCKSNPVECSVKTRIWQLCMITELMVGAAQGRTDLSTELSTIDLSITTLQTDANDSERIVSRQFPYEVRVARNIRAIAETYYKLRRQNKDWALDPTFISYNQDFRKWPNELPTDMQIQVGDGGIVSNVPSHFVANMHCHYELGTVLLYKPQLTASKDFANDNKWKYFMTMCHSSSKRILFFQEAILRQYGTLGLSAMIRGISFHIYAILTCTMIHLIAICAPDPRFNKGAKDLFIRHMRVLEQCIKEWPVTEVQTQINQLRAAFSVNLNKPFDLKASFPYNTPSESRSTPELSKPVDPYLNSDYYAAPVHHVQNSSLNKQRMNVATIPPPTSRVHSNIVSTPYVNHRPPYSSSVPPALYEIEAWNPTPIIDQFATAFAIPQSALVPPISTHGSSPPILMPQQSLNQAQSYMSIPYSDTSQSTIYNPPPASYPQTSSYPTAHQAIAMPDPVTPHPPHPTLEPYFSTPITMPSSMDSILPNSDALRTTISNQSQHQLEETKYPHTGAPVYVSAKEWQRSVASVFDPGGLKRKYQADMLQCQHDYPQNSYSSLG